MSKLYYLFILLLISTNLKAQVPADTVLKERLEKVKQLTLISQQTKDITIKCKEIASRALDESPNPIATISTEGRLKGDPIKTATQLSLKDFNKIYALSVAYKLTEEKKYLNKATGYLLAWAKVNKPAGNPINDTNLDAAIDGYNLIKPSLKKEDIAAIENWLRATANEEIKSMVKSLGKETAYNNWHSHRLKVLVEIAAATDDPTQIELLSNLVKEQIAANLLPDGSSIDFKLRDALHYHAYDLEPLLKLSIVFKKLTGIDFYNYQAKNGASIKKSVEWLAPYLTGEKKHAEFVNSTVKFDQDRAKNGEAGYQKGTLFEPQMGLKTLALAGYFNPAYDEIYKNIKGDTQPDADWQMLYRMLILL